MGNRPEMSNFPCINGQKFQCMEWTSLRRMEGRVKRLTVLKMNRCVRGAGMVEGLDHCMNG